jgi:endonuclease/exonuclease/phosphatase (EEP) superfamily protein YafD
MKNGFDPGQSPLLRKLVQQLAFTLLLCYAASFGARWHWILDLFSHFTWQYALGGILILMGLLLVRSWKYAALIALLTVANIGELYRHADFARNPGAAPTITVALYNRNVGPVDQATLKQWLTDNAKNFDVVVIQEASVSVEKMAGEIGTLYPFQLQEARKHAFGTVILSRHEFTDMERISFPDLSFANFAVRFTIQPPQFKQPVTIFALHALPPIGADVWQQRNIELATVARRAGQDTTPHRIMMGDWNVTPYSPFFADVLRDSRLTWKIGAPMPVPTWPTLGFPWLMQIKIDHILSSDNLALVDTERANPTFSDHYAVIARFAEK